MAGKHYVGLSVVVAFVTYAALANDVAAKPQVMQQQMNVLTRRYDLTDHPIPGVMMSGGRRAVQGGGRVALRMLSLGAAMSDIRWWGWLMGASRALT